MPAKKQDTSKTKLNTDKFLDAGYICVVLDTHPITQAKEPYNDLVAIGTFAQNGTGIKAFGASVSRGKLSDEHFTQDVATMAKTIFASQVKKHGSKWVVDKLSGASDELKKLARIAKINSYNLAIEDLSDLVQMSKDLQKERDGLQSQIDEINANLDKAKKDVANEIGVDATFEVALSSERGFYIPTTVKKSKQEVKRTFDKNVYEYTGNITGDDGKKHAVKRVLTITQKDTDGNPTDYHVKLVCDGKTFASKKTDDLDSMYKVTQDARNKLMDNYLDKSKSKTRAVHTYSFFGMD